MSLSELTGCSQAADPWQAGIAVAQSPVARSSQATRNPLGYEQRTDVSSLFVVPIKDQFAGTRPFPLRLGRFRLGNCR